MSRAIILAACLGGINAAALGQSAWNRQIAGVAITPGDAGDFDVHVAWTLSVAPTSVPLDLGVVFELRLNGTTFAASPHAVEIDGGSGICGPGPGCSGGCGSGTFDGLANDLFCVPDECDCRPLDLVATFDAVPLTPGDEITVILYPSPGALPETDPDGDTYTVVFDGEARFWDRAVTGITVQPTSGGPPGVYDLEVDLALYARYEGLAPSIARLVALVNGSPAGPDLSPFDDLTLAVCPEGCQSNCAFDTDGLPRGVCEIIDVPPEPWMSPPCPCYAYYGITVPAVALTPGDEITVILYPAPGALPELPIPGLQADNQLVRSFYMRGDLNCDGSVNAFDIDPFVLALTSPEGYAASFPDCDRMLADCNGDGAVNAFDIDPFVLLLVGR
jgi:hypothetical protein